MSGDAYFRTILALLFVLGLVVACSWVLRRYTKGGLNLSRGTKRIGVVDVLTIDPKRRLMLIRRDGIEHLLLLGPANDLVIESGIHLPPLSGSFAAELTESSP